MRDTVFNFLSSLKKFKNLQRAYIEQLLNNDNTGKNKIVRMFLLFFPFFCVHRYISMAISANNSVKKSKFFLSSTQLYVE